MALTAKQTAFAHAVVAGGTLSDAYRLAYNAENMSKAVIRNEASKLIAHHDITVLVERLRAANQRVNTAAQVSDRDRVLTKLRDMMDTAETEAVQLNAAVWLGKSTAAFTDVHRDDSDKGLSAAEIQAEIEERLAVLDKAAKLH